MSLEYWDWKVEPCSTPLGPDSPSEWSVQEFDADSNGFQSPPASVPSRADLAQQLLNDLEEYVKEEESFPTWFDDDKTILHTLPIFDDLQPISPVCLPPPSSVDLTALTTVNQNYLKDEVTYSLGHGHLTPPQSPPSTVPELILTLQHQQPFVPFESCQSEYGQEFLLSPAPTSPEVAREMAVLDAVVRGVAQEWEHMESSDSSSRSSDGTGPDESDDPEWEPEAAAAKTTTRRARRGRPYNVQDKRQRKKEQNKTAATRYRQKKKAEVTTIVDEERSLCDDNARLRSKVTDVEKEISYLKNLMREMFRAKGLLK